MKLTYFVEFVMSTQDPIVFDIEIILKDISLLLNVESESAAYTSPLLVTASTQLYSASQGDYRVIRQTRRKRLQ
jgi:hypothetical protein